MNHHAANMTANKQSASRSHDAAVVNMLRADPTLRMSTWQ